MGAAKRVLVIVLSAAALVLLAILIPVYLKGDRLLSVQSNSMSPLFTRGDAVEVKRVSLDKLSAGKVVSYFHSQDRRVIVTHRLILVDKLNGVFITKGDNLTYADIPVPSSLMVGQVTRTIPNLGFVLDWLHKPLGLAVAVYLPGIIIVASEIKRLNRHYQIFTFGRPSATRVRVYKYYN